MPKVWEFERANSVKTKMPLRCSRGPFKFVHCDGYQACWRKTLETERISIRLVMEKSSSGRDSSDAITNQKLRKKLPRQKMCLLVKV